MPLADAPHARAALRVEVARAAPGRPFLAAVEIDTDPHWHVYWRNPGDSGIPTTIAWTAPKDWRVEPLEFPTPRRFAPGGVTAYGYEGRTLFLARITPSSAPGTLFARVKWLVCSEACVPGGASLTAKVPLGSSKRNLEAAKLQAAQRALPEPSRGWAVVATAGKRVTLTVAAPLGMSSLPRTLEFFPLQSGVIDQAKSAVATNRGGRFVFQMDASPFPEKRSHLPGLLVAGGGRNALIVDPILKPER